jgi:hypothetical protein
MHVRISRERRGSKIYEYPQLVESFRREDGMPATRVIKQLSHLSALELENLKAALAASKRGRRVFVGKAPAGRPPKATANLDYLGIAVLLELWRQWQLDELVDGLLGIGDAVVTPAAVVAALVLQRCVAPGSKLSAERWFPRSALPELLGVAPKHFNNTRIHRVLDALDQCRVDLMAKLPRRYTERDGAFAAMFLDVTDTWFVGHGPKMAERAKTKEGVVRRKVGIVLLCNERGYPLRWEVLRGAESDKSSMTRTVAAIAGRRWVGDAPIVCDRSMGNTAQIRQLLKTNIRFVTALVKSEFGAYSEAIPHQPFADIVVSPGKNERDKQAAIAARLAQSAGMDKVDDRLYVRDLGVIERQTDDEASYEDYLADTDPVVRAVRLGRNIREAVADGRAESLAAAGRMFGLSKGLTHKYRRLSDLSEEIQLAVLEGKAKGASLGEMLSIVEQSNDAQHEAFEQLLQRIAARGGKRLRSNDPPRQTTSTKELPVRVRGVIYFNPEMFIDQRRIAQRRLADIEEFTRQLNGRLQSPRSKLNKAKALAQVEQKLKTWDLVEAYDVRVDELNDLLSVRATLKADEWAHRRRYDGFSLLVAHPDIPHSAAELCRLYRAKDTVEKDFETIKSFVELRPVRHRLDAKVRAHVTICMLALLLERSLNDKLGNDSTAQHALEELSRCHLNHYATQGSVAAYDVTTIDQTQRKILRKLRLQQLAEDDEVMERITPR